MRARPALFCVGRPFSGDDAVGLVVADRLCRRGIPAQRITDGAALVAALAEERQALIVDAAVGAGPPGSLIYLSANSLFATDAPDADLPRIALVSSHGISVRDAIRIARALGGAIDIHVLAISVDRSEVRPSDQLSPEAERAAEGATERITSMFATGRFGDASGETPIAALHTWR